MKTIRNLILFSCLFGSSLVIPAKHVRSVNAAEEQEKILTTNPFEDLIQDEQFKVDYLNGVYKYQTGANIEFLNLAEYKFENTYTENYGLYVYFYNPDDSKKINLFSEENKIEISTDGNHYKKYNLISISRSTDEIQDMFYKFRVDTDEEFYNSLNSNERTYYISSFELKCRNQIQTIDTKIGLTLKFTGYAAGCNGNSESTLECNKEGLETIHLKTYGGTKRSGYINENLTKCIDLHYVYFQIPNKYIDTFGEPYSVSYEFYDAYLDKGVFNIVNEGYYIPDEWWQRGDNDAGSYINFVDPWLYNNSPSSYMAPLFTINDLSYAKDNKFNTFNTMASSPYDRNFLNSNPDYYAPYQSTYLYRDHAWQFTPGLIGDRAFRKSAWNSEITREELEQKIDEYGLDYFSTNIQYSGVIESTIEDISDPAAIYTEHPNANWWYSLLAEASTSGKTPWGRTQEAGTTWGEIPAFEMVTRKDDVNGSVWTIDRRDVDNFNENFENAQGNDSSLFILRFHETEYWSAPAYFQRDSLLGINGTRYTEIGYSAFSHVIDRFDIISLTFKMNDKYNVIPVVSDPIRIVPGITPPVDDRPEDYSWFKDFTDGLGKINIKLIIGIIAGVILVFLIIKLIIKIKHSSEERKTNKAIRNAIKEDKKSKKDKHKNEE